MRILELCHYSARICGVWNRVREEASLLTKRGYQVRVFSSNLVKGSKDIAPSEGEFKGVKIRRFKAKKLGGESFMYWDFEKDALKYNPDIIVAHSYRQIHTTAALKIGKKIGAKVFLVTHAPFVENDLTRSFFAKFFVRLYDWFIGPFSLNKFDKIIAITKWEIPYLERLGAMRNKMEYIPNGIPKVFFQLKKGKEENKILFLGRISPIKNLEVLIKAFSLIKNKKIKLEIVGPTEKDYLIELENLIRKFKLEKRISFSPPIFDLREKINKIDSAKIFILPSKSEAMPQALIEAMARGKIVIGSDNRGIKELIKNGENGYLFRVGDPEELAKKIDLGLKGNKKMKKEAKKSVGRFNWGNIIKKIEGLLV